jgi:hypothetical protein
MAKMKIGDLIAPNVRAHRPPLESGSGSESSVRQTRSPEFEPGSGGSSEAICSAAWLSTVVKLQQRNVPPADGGEQDGERQT